MVFSMITALLYVKESNDKAYHAIHLQTATVDELLKSVSKWLLIFVESGAVAEGYSCLELWSSVCTGTEVRFPLPALILLQFPWLRDLLYIIIT